jgi:hypothetical protein
MICFERLFVQEPKVKGVSILSYPSSRTTTASLSTNLPFNRSGPFLFKRLSSKRSDEAREICKIAMRIGIKPTGYGVRAKRKHYRADRLIRVGRRYRFDCWLDHSRFSLPGRFVFIRVRAPLENDTHFVI